MGSFVLGAQVLLAAVFAAAGVGKLLDQPGSRRALADFGVPEKAVSVAGLLLPLAELATAVALVAHPSARWGAAAAMGLLLAFTGAIAAALLRGRAPDCHCFGQIHSAPAGRSTLVRNAALAVLAAVVAWHGPGPSVDAWVAARTAAELVAVGTGVGAVALAALSLSLWLTNRGLRRELAAVRQASAALPPGLPLGAAAPSFALRDLRGETVTLDSLRERGRPVALVFASPGCASCEALLPDLARWQTALADQVTVALISSGSAQENRAAADQHGLVDVLVQDGSEIVDAYRIRGTPSAVVVTPEGTIQSAPSEGPLGIEPLIRVTLQGGARSQVQRPVVENGARSEQPQASG